MADNPAQDTAKSIQEAQQRMKELNAEIKRLGGEGFGDVNALAAKFGNSLADATKQVKFMQDEVDDLKNAFGNIADTLKNVVDDINGSVKASTLLTRNFNKLEDLSRKVQQHKSNENILSVKELKDIQTKINKEKDSLVTNLQIAKTQESELKKKQKLGTITKAESEELRKNLQYQDEVSKALSDQAGYLNQIVKLTADEVKEEEKVSKALGVTGHAFKGITGFLEKIGVDSKYFDGINDKLRESAKSGSQWKVVGTGIKGVFSGIGQFLADPLGKLLIMVAVTKELIELGLHFNKQAAELGKEYGLAGENAREMTHAVEQMSVGTNNVFLNSKNITAAMGQMNDDLGTSAMFTQDLVQGQIDLTTKMGMSGEEAAKISDYAILTGKSQNDIVKGITSQNTGLLSNKKILQEVAKTEGQLAAFYKNDPVLIGKAVIQAQKLGMTLNQTKQATDALLDIESSLQNEYEAEALIGKDINLNQARYLAMMGDTAGAAKEMLANVGGIAGFTKLNRIQQDALAKTMGMSSDELANTLTKQEKLSKLTGAQRAEIEKLRKDGKGDQADAIEKAVMEGKSVDMAKQQVATQEKLAAAADKFKDILASIVGGPIGTLLDGLAGALGIINKVFGVISKLKTPLMIIGGIFGTIWAAAKGIQLAETITAALQGKKLGFAIKENFLKVKDALLGDKEMAQMAIELAREKNKISFKTLSKDLEGQSLMTKTRAYAIALKEWGVQKWKALTSKEQLVTDQSDLAVQEKQNVVGKKGLLQKTKEFLIGVKTLAIEKGKAMWEKIQTVYEQISLSIKKKGLAVTIKDFFKSIGEAAMGAVKSLSSIPVVGWGLGIAAAATTVALGMKLMSKGNDVVSPGYGKRTLMAPEGAIALNNKDTVIAGTNLGGKGGGKSEGKTATPTIDLTPMINAINEVTAAVKGLMDRPTSVYLDGKEMAQKLQGPMAITTRKTG
jgi:hypothetical protein